LNGLKHLGVGDISKPKQEVFYEKNSNVWNFSSGSLFVVLGVDQTAKFQEVVKGVIPFALIMIGSVLIIVFFKPLSLWLPGLIG